MYNLSDMAYFNEGNVTEQMCIDIAKKAGYIYSKPDDLREAKNDVICEHLLQQALTRINLITNHDCVLFVFSLYLQ